MVTRATKKAIPKPSTSKVPEPDLFSSVDPKRIVKNVLIEDLEIDYSYNKREDYGNLEPLAKAIAEFGIETPLRGFLLPNGKTRPTDGYRRLKAIALVEELYGKKILAVPMIYEDPASSPGDHLFTQMVTNLFNKRLNPLEISYIITDLKNLGFDAEMISARSGLPLDQVNIWMHDSSILNSALPPVKEALEAGQVAPSVALDVLSELGHEEGKEVITDAIAKAKEKGKLKASAAEVHAARVERTAATATLPTPPAPVPFAGNIASSATAPTPLPKEERPAALTVPPVIIKQMADFMKKVDWDELPASVLSEAQAIILKWQRSK